MALEEGTAEMGGIEEIGSGVVRNRVGSAGSGTIILPPLLLDLGIQVQFVLRVKEGH